MKPLNGYIEGYYGRLLTWQERDRIISSLKRNKMTLYFYAPKEDEKHRLNWKYNYNNSWKRNFKKFSLKAKSNQVTIIAGISPGLDFDFEDFKKQSSKDKISNDFQILLNKISEFLQFSNVEVGLLFDDLPNNFKYKYGNLISEGSMHAELANAIAENFNRNIYVVPRIYADELIHENQNYLTDFGRIINKSNYTFYSGKNIVSEKISRTFMKKLSKLIPTKIIIWDNFYANDYCPRKLFVGPLIARKGIQNLMINPTGLIQTDLLILDIFKATQNSDNPNKVWKCVMLNHQVPKNFFAIKNFFLKPDIYKSPNLNKNFYKNKNYENLDFLLWKWKTPLSREWFPFLLGLKHDLQLSQMDLSSERIIKTQTKPLAKYLL